MTETWIGTTSGLHLVGGERDLDGHEITALAPGEASLWAILDGSVVSRIANAGWEHMATVQRVRANCLLPLAESVLVGTGEAHLLRLQGAALEPLESFGAVDGRDDWYTPWGGPPDVRSLAADADGTIYANVHVGGIPRSRDGGDTWVPTIDIDADVHQVIVHGGAVFAATAHGLAVSDDGGDSWRFETEGLHATYCRAVAVTGDTLLLTVSTSHLGRQAAVYRRPLRGGTFERCTRGLPEWFDDNIDTYRLTATEGGAVFGTSDGRVFASDDEGGTWHEVAAGLARVTAVASA